MLKRFIDSCATTKIFDGVKKILIAVSGGADSLALAELLTNSRQRFNLEISIAHFEHGLRGQTSIDDAAFVKNFAEERGLNFVGGQGDVKIFAAQQKISIETAARILRYEFLSNARQKLNCDAIATAHHADDQAETILMRFLRGATSAGLSAMQARTFAECGLILRPLLNFRKAELENFCREKNLSPRIDATNFETDATRNKIRLELLPTLEKFNPALVETLCRFGKISADEANFIDEQAEKIFPRRRSRQFNRSRRVSETSFRNSTRRHKKIFCACHGFHERFRIRARRRRSKSFAQRFVGRRVAETSPRRFKTR